ncbi:MAG: YcxB family protein [Agriterribacter sp.]
MFVGLYKKPAFILAAILGLYFITTVILDYAGVIIYYVETPIFEIVCGIFLLIFQPLIILISVKQFKSNPSFRHDMIFAFSDNGITIQGLTFKSEFTWAHIIKQKEVGKFLILYHTKKFGNFIDKTKLTAEQLDFIKSKIGKK